MQMVTKKKSVLLQTVIKHDRGSKPSLLLNISNGYRHTLINDNEAAFPGNTWIKSIPSGVTTVTWPHAPECPCGLPVLHLYRRGGIYCTWTDPLHFLPAATESLILLLSLLPAFSSCRRKIKGIGSYICRLSCLGYLSLLARSPVCLPLLPPAAAGNVSG